jgi:hypothetical protein
MQQPDQATTNFMDAQMLRAQFTIDSMFELFLKAKGLDPRRLAVHQLIGFKKAFVGGVAQTIVLMTMCNGKESVDPSELLQQLLNECERFMNTK